MQTNMNGKHLLRDLKLHTDYLKWDSTKGRYENWAEATSSIIDGHKKKYFGLPLSPYLKLAKESLTKQQVLASQRTLQYRHAQLEQHNARVYNCVSLYIARNRAFQEAFYLGLCGCGVGWGLLKPMVNNLSSISSPEKDPVVYVIEDSIEGWADAAGVLLSSYFDTDQPFPEYAKTKVIFDSSKVRPKGSFINGGFKAPGPEGLINSLEKIRLLLDSWIEKEGNHIRPILAYDILCHLSDAILSGGVRRSAANAIVDFTDEEMTLAKTGDWFSSNPQRGRSNNSVLLIRGLHTEEDFKKLFYLNQGIADIGFVFANSYFDMFNPCYEIAKVPFLVDGSLITIDNAPYEKVEQIIRDNKDKLGVQGCNLTEINGEAIKNEEDLFEATKAATILGTLQAGYTSFPYLGSVSEAIFKRESLLGVSITGWTSNPWLFENPDSLRKAAQLAIDVNTKLAKILDINPAARVTTVKPSGNASVLLCTSAGANPDHSARSFRCMQINKEMEAAKYLLEHYPSMLEESYYSANQTDYVIYVPIENSKDSLFANTVNGVNHLEKVLYIQENWVLPGTVTDRCVYDGITHNTSCTIIIKEGEEEEVCDYIWKNRDTFRALSFATSNIDKDYRQAPITTVLSASEILEEHGRGAMLASGLIVDALHYFDNDLWRACELLLDRDSKVTGTKESVLLKKYWLTRARKFAKNFFKRDLLAMTYCLKEVHLFHKWETITRELKPVDIGAVLSQPEYQEIGNFAAAACSGGACFLPSLGDVDHEQN